MVQEERLSREPVRPGDSAGGGSGKDVRADVEALRSDISALRRDLSALVHDLVATGKVQAGDAGQAFSSAARSRLEDYGATMGNLAGQKWQDTGQEVFESIQAQVEQRPLMSIGIAFGLGMVLGSIFRRT